MEIIHQSPWNLACLVCPVPSTYVGMLSPALGSAVLRCGDNVASLPPHSLTQQSGLNKRLASDICRVCQKYNCMVLFLSGLRQQNNHCFERCCKCISAISLLLNLGAAQRGRSVLFSGEQKLLFEGWSKGFVMITKLNFMRH
jgi:hypothetical protein